MKSQTRAKKVNSKPPLKAKEEPAQIVKESELAQKMRSKNKRTMLPTQEDSNENTSTISKRKLKPSSMRSSASTNQAKKVNGAVK